MLWKAIRSVPGAEASEDGAIRFNGKLMRQHPRVRGYLGVCFVKRQMLVNRLVCEAFHGPPPFPKAEALHLDNDRKNNRASNLKWGTHAENMEMDRGNNHSHACHNNPNRKLTAAAVNEIRQAFDTRNGFRWGGKALARKFGVSYMQVHRIANRLEGGWVSLEVRY